MAQTSGKFTKGTNRGTKACSICKRNTQEGLIDPSTGLCTESPMGFGCYDLAGIENEHQDGYHDETASKDCPTCFPNDARFQPFLTEGEVPAKAPRKPRTPKAAPKAEIKVTKTSSVGGPVPTAKELGACWCGCGAPAKSRFLQGHDAKLKSTLIKAFEVETISISDVQALVAGVPVEALVAIPTLFKGRFAQVPADVIAALVRWQKKAK